MRAAAPVPRLSPPKAPLFSRSRPSVLLIGLSLLLTAAPGAHADTRRFDQGNRLITVQWEPSPGQKVLETAFDVELRDPGAPDPVGGRSMNGAAAIDCLKGLAKLTQLVVHAEPGQKGAVVRRFPQQTTWVRPEASSLLSAVMKGVCAATAAVPRPRASQAAQAALLSTPAPTSASTPASPSRPVREAVQAPSPVARSRDVDARPDAPARGDFRIQVGSFPTRAGAEARAALLSQRAPALPPARLETAQVKAATYHRVLIDGFASAGAAEAACRELRASGTPCLVKTSVRR